MSDRERWIVYPLLFLALGAALRDKLAKQTRAKQIVCEQLYMVDAEGRPMAVLTGSELRFDPAGRGNGFIKANTIDAESLFERGRPVAEASAARLYQQFLQMLGQLRLPGAAKARPNLRLVPNPPRPSGTIPPPEGESPSENPAPPEGGPKLTPPTAFPREPSPAA